MVTLEFDSDEGLVYWYVCVHGTRKSIDVTFHDPEANFWPDDLRPKHPYFSVGDNRRRKGGGTSFWLVEGPNAFTDIALLLLHVLA